MRPLFAALLGLLLGTSALQAQSNDQFFRSAEECLAGPRNYYTPKYLSGRGKNPVDGVKIVRAPLESDACVYLHVVGRYAWVWQKEGTPYRWLKMSNGSLRIMARDDCGNNAPLVVYPKPAPADVTRVVSLPPAEKVAQVDTTVIKVVQGGPLVMDHRFVPSAPPTSQTQFESDYGVRPKKGGFWCFRGAWQGATCTAIVGGLGYGAWRWRVKGGDPRVELPTVIALPPGPGA